MRKVQCCMALLLPAAFLTLATPAFDTNDDTASMFTVCGFWTGQPGDALIFTSLRISRALRFLYEHWPTPNWYVWYQYAVLFAANAVITVFVMRTHKPSNFDKLGRFHKAEWLLAFLWCVVFFLPTLLRLQYTVTACWAGIAGWLLLAEVPRQPCFRWHLYLAAGAFLFLCTLIRYQAFWGISLLLGPLLVFRAWQGKERRVFSLSYWPVGVVLLLPLLHERLENSERLSLPRGDTTTLTYQTAIDAVVNGPNCTDEEHLRANGFSANDLLLVQSWFWIDNTVFAPEKIKRLGQGIRCPRPLLAGLRHFAGSLYMEWPYVFLALLCTAAFGLFGAEQRSRTLWTGLYLSVIFLFLSYWSRLPFRVMFPFMAAAFVWLHSNQASASHRRRHENACGILLLVAIIVCQSANLWRQNVRNQTSRREFREAAAWLGQRPETLFVVQGDSFNYEGAFSWKNPVTANGAHNLVPTGYLLHTPVFFHISDKNGINDLTLALLDKHPIVLINPPVEALRRFYREHYNREVRLLPTESGIVVEGKRMPAFVVSP